MAVTKEKKEEILKQFQINKNDAGSSEVQVALLTSEIKGLTEHLSRNPKDYSTQRGLMLKVGRRKKILKYLQNTKKESYKKIIDQLAIRG